MSKRRRRVRHRVHRRSGCPFTSVVAGLSIAVTSGFILGECAASCPHVLRASMSRMRSVFLLLPQASYQQPASLPGFCRQGAIHCVALCFNTSPRSSWHFLMHSDWQTSFRFGLP
jgi:hypothetical protein